MITRERLEELISQRAIIYSTDWDEAVELSPETCTVENIKISEYGEEICEKLFVKEDERHIPSYRLSALEEDIETEKFKKEFQNITREEILNLPTWEEIQYTQHYFIYKFPIKDNYDFFGIITILKDYNIKVSGLVQGVLFEEYFNEAASKDNYIKACTIARKLFLGESVDEIW